jgi:hypothetical protein
MLQSNTIIGLYVYNGNRIRFGHTEHTGTAIEIKFQKYKRSVLYRNKKLLLVNTENKIMPL